METIDILLLGAVAIGGYFVYKTFIKPIADVVGGGENLVSAVTTPGYKQIENILGGITLPSLPSVNLPSVSDVQKTLLSTPVTVAFWAASALGLVGGKTSVGYAAPGTPATPKITTPQVSTRLAPFVSVAAPAGVKAQVTSSALSFKLRSLK
jgi:hypothetical protein